MPIEVIGTGHAGIQVSNLDAAFPIERGTVTYRIGAYGR